MIKLELGGLAKRSKAYDKYPKYSLMDPNMVSIVGYLFIYLQCEGQRAHYIREICTTSELLK